MRIFFAPTPLRQSLLYDVGGIQATSDEGVGLGLTIQFTDRNALTIHED